MRSFTFVTIFVTFTVLINYANSKPTPQVSPIDAAMTFNQKITSNAKKIDETVRKVGEKFFTSGNSTGTENTNNSNKLAKMERKAAAPNKDEKAKDLNGKKEVKNKAQINSKDEREKEDSDESKIYNESDEKSDESKIYNESDEKSDESKIYNESDEKNKSDKEDSDESKIYNESEENDDETETEIVTEVVTEFIEEEGTTIVYEDEDYDETTTEPSTKDSSK